MAKPLTEEQIRDFELFCEETLMNEDDPGYFCLSQYEPFEAQPIRTISTSFSPR
jgi:hypothetical protein